MDIPSSSNQRHYTCHKHNQPIILQDPQNNKGPLCFVCIQNLTGLVPPDQIKKQQQELFNQQKKEINEEKQQLQNALDSILNYKSNIIQSLDKIITGIIDQIEIIDKFVKNQQELIELGNNTSIEKLKTEYLIQNQNNIKVRNLAKSQLQDFQIKYCSVDKMIILLDDKSKVAQKNESKDSRKFQYELIKESSKKQNECLSFAFNKDGNLLIVGCGSEIIIYEFNNGQMIKEIQRLTNHTHSVSCLHFMKQSNSFVSGSYDKSIIVWELNSTGKWTVKTQLKQHKDFVLCILMNKNKDMLISGSQDGTVKFWRNKKNKWSCQQTVELQDCSNSLSLNEQENKLISCGSYRFIYVMELQSENLWSIVQTVKVIKYGQRLSFLNRDQFIFQPETKDFLELYNYDTNLKQFQKYKQIQIQSCQYCDNFFPIQFIKDLKIVTVKHGQYLNIFKINDDNDLTLMQTIEFGDGSLFGFCSDDGKYIATWDEKLKEIQIRQLRYLD